MRKYLMPIDKYHIVRMLMEGNRAEFVANKVGCATVTVYNFLRSQNLRPGDLRLLGKAKADPMTVIEKYWPKLCEEIQYSLSDGKEPATAERAQVNQVNTGAIHDLISALEAALGAAKKLRDEPNQVMDLSAMSALDLLAKVKAGELNGLVA